MRALAIVLLCTTASAEQRDVKTHWQGRYVCAQGVTSVDIELVRGVGDAVRGTFTFGPLPENKSVPHGKYSIAGKLSGDEVRMVPDAWIQHPEGYVMVGFRASPDWEHRHLAGKITFDVCGAIDLERARE